MHNACEQDVSSMSLDVSFSLYFLLVLFFPPVSLVGEPLLFLCVQLLVFWDLQEGVVTASR